MGLINDFKKFASRGNLLDMAIGFTVGAAFTTIAKSLVNDIIMPPIGLMTGSSDFADMFLVLKEGAETKPPYATLADAQSAGAVTLNYGVFVNSVLAFVLVTIVMFVIIRIANRAEDALEEQFSEPKPEGEPENKKCAYCRMTIPYRASRCGHCTSQLEETSPAT